MWEALSRLDVAWHPSRSKENLRARLGLGASKGASALDCRPTVASSKRPTVWRNRLDFACCFEPTIGGTFALQCGIEVPGGGRNRSTLLWCAHCQKWRNSASPSKVGPPIRCGVQDGGGSRWRILPSTSDSPTATLSQHISRHGGSREKQGEAGEKGTFHERNWNEYCVSACLTRHILSSHCRKPKML
jgi:hypothetical protein